MVFMLFALIIDCIWKTFYMGTWYGSMIVCIVLIFQVLALNYEAKLLFGLSLVSRPTSYATFTLCQFI